jgi:hypothetical protein
MPISPSSSPSDGSVTVRTEKGQATFLRTGPNSVTLDLKYDVNGLSANISGTSLHAGVAALCEGEIVRMRHALTELGDELAGQLRDDGKDIVLKHTWHDKDERTWGDTRQALYVKPSTNNNRMSLTIPSDVADAKLVREAVRQVIAGREDSIRKLYARILAEAEKRRDGQQSDAVAN